MKDFDFEILHKLYAVARTVKYNKQENEDVLISHSKKIMMKWQRPIRILRRLSYQAFPYLQTMRRDRLEENGFNLIWKPYLYQPLRP